MASMLIVTQNDRMPHITMTQQEALDILKLGHNVYITGPAGSGKTYVLNKYIDYLKDHDVDIGVTASTGIAATHMGGVTIHAWSGLGVKDSLSEYDLEAMQEKQYLWKRFEKVKVLIIDEVSMLHHFRLDLVDRITRTFKRNNKPFGGIQVILCGDFFQLPPVSRMGEPETHFVYRSEAWRDASFKVCYLEEQHRQKDDALLQILNDIRGNRVNETTMEHLQKCYKEVRDGDDLRKSKKSAIDIEPTRLYTHNIDVDSVNEKELAKLNAKETTYDMHTRGNETLVSILQKSCLAPQRLRLRVGAKVMFVKNNFEGGYANGTLGTVTSLTPSGPVVKTASGKLIHVTPESWKIEEEGKVKAELQQYPLRLAWAITVHKSQGMSLDAIEVDLSKSFEKGMGYVALSRVRTLAGLVILGMHPSALAVNEEILEYDELLRELSEDAQSELLGDKNLAANQDKFIRRVAGDGVFDAAGKKVVKGKKGKVGAGARGELSTYETTRVLLEKELTIPEIADHRGMTPETILTHLEKIIESDPLARMEIEYLRETIPARRFTYIKEALREAHEKHGDWRLAPVKNILTKGNMAKMMRPAVTYFEIQLVRLFVKPQKD